MNAELQSFVKEALGKGAERNEIAHILKKAGWEATEIDTALASYAGSHLGLAVPRRRPYTSAREAFLYLVMFLTLYVSAFSVGQLLYQFINRWLPDTLPGYDYLGATLSTIRMDTAAITIAFPVFLFVSWRLHTATLRDPDKRSSKVRKWLTYLTLFVAAGIIIGDLIALVFNVLSGELTLRFGLKVLTVAAIAGSIFGYYLLDLRSDEKDI
jgi:hypothetical protein